MNRQRPHYPIGLLAQVLRVSRSGFYAWRQRPVSARRLADMAAKPLIREAHRLSRETYGPRRLQTELAARGLILGRDHIGRLRKEMGLGCRQRRKFKATTNSAHALPVEPNLLGQRFTSISKPGTVYGSALTSIPTEEGWLYLAGVKDFATRARSSATRWASGWARSWCTMRRRRPFATGGRSLRASPTFDRGSPYCALSYRKALKKARMRSSMSGRGNCTDNAPTESFWGALKQELVHPRRFATRGEAKAAIQEYIEVFYNRMRRHSALGNLAPAVFAETYYAQRRSA